MQRTIDLAVLMLFTFGACTGGKKDTASIQVNPVNNQSTHTMNSYVSIFEIPVTDIQRAINFYEGIFNLKIEKMEMSGMQMGILPYEDQMVTGVLIKEKGYEPSAHGVTLYLNGGENLQVILDKVGPHGGKIVIPKTPHADDSGYFALFLDTEGNKLGLHSSN
ncbi:MAG: VOC family protein [Flavobacteriaceae bacterium]